MILAAILLVILLLAILEILPAWPQPHYQTWDYAPPEVIGAGLVILLLLMLSRLG